MQSGKFLHAELYVLMIHGHVALDMPLDTLREPQASGCLKLSICWFNPEITTASLCLAACSGARETLVKKACVSSGHQLVPPPPLSECMNIFDLDGIIRPRLGHMYQNFASHPSSDHPDLRAVPSKPALIVQEQYLSSNWLNDSSSGALQSFKEHAVARGPERLFEQKTDSFTVLRAIVRFAGT